MMDAVSVFADSNETGYSVPPALGKTQPQQNQGPTWGAESRATAGARTIVPFMHECRLFPTLIPCAARYRSGFFPERLLIGKLTLLQHTLVCAACSQSGRGRRRSGIETLLPPNRT